MYGGKIFFWASLLKSAQVCLSFPQLEAISPARPANRSVLNNRRSFGERNSMEARPTLMRSRDLIFPEANAALQRLKSPVDEGIICVTL